MKPTLLVSIISISFLTWTCTQSDQETAAKVLKNEAVVVAFVDRSESTKKDRELYDRAIYNILEKLESGDRFILGFITESSSRDFVANLDVQFPPPMRPKTLMDIELKYKQELSKYNEDLKSFKEKLKQEVQEVLRKESRAVKTDIFNSLIIAGQFFQSEKRKKDLVLLSDMLEDSGSMNFETMSIDETFIKKEITRQKKFNIIPDLDGVSVYVVGARANTTEKASQVQKFWFEYFKESGAKIIHYSRTLVSFEK